MSKNWEKGEEIKAAGLNDTGFGFKVVAKDPASLVLRVNPGVALVEGQVVKFAGGDTPSFTAPTTNPRIDLVSVDSAGTIKTYQGSENVSPVASSYPAGETVLAEIYCRPGMTSIGDNDKADGQGYIYRDSRPLGASIVLIDETSGAADAGKGIKTNEEGFLDRSFLKYDCGDGSDGDVVISSPTTLTRDMYYNNLTVNDVLEPNGWAIYVKEVLDGSGTIRYNGSTGGAGNVTSQGGAGANANTNGYLRNTPGAGGGGAGRSGSNYGGGAGGVGGYRNANNGAAGSGVTAGSGGAGNAGRISYAQPSVQSGGDGGNSGTSGSSNAGGASGGGGGSSGGIIAIKADTIAGSFTIEAIGGNGGAGGVPAFGHTGGGSNSSQGAGGNKGETFNRRYEAIDSIFSALMGFEFSTGEIVPIEIPGAGGGGGGGGGNNSTSANGSGGGGGGGNGGIVLLWYRVKSAWSGSINVSGGAGGAGGAVGRAGQDGIDGSTGLALQIQM